MNFLRKLFSGPPKPERWSWARRGIKPLDVRSQEFNREIVGESNYQKEIKAARKERQSDFVPIYLKREPNNEYDTNAVAIKSGTHERLGYLKRGIARRYAEVLDEVEAAGFNATSVGKLAGGERGKSIGVWIDLPGVPAIREKLQSRQTGE